MARGARSLQRAHELGESGASLEGLAQGRVPRARLSRERSSSGSARTPRIATKATASPRPDGADARLHVRHGRRRRRRDAGLACARADAPRRGDDSVRNGWVALSAACSTTDRDEKDRFRDALEIAQRFGDTDLQFCVLGVSRREPRPRRSDRRRHAAAGRSVRGGRRRRRRRLLRPRGDLLPALLGVRARTRRRARRPVDPRRGGRRASDGTSRRSRRSAGRTTAASSPRPDDGPKPKRR